MWIRLECNRLVNRSASKSLWINMAYITGVRIDKNHNHIHLYYGNSQERFPMTDSNIDTINMFLRQEKIKP